jgi:hypothetical protein
MKSVMSHTTSSITIQQSFSVECFLISSTVTIVSTILFFESEVGDSEEIKVTGSALRCFFGEDDHWLGGASSLVNLPR